MTLVDLSPNCLRKLLIRNSQQSFRPLRSTGSDLKLPLTKADNGQKEYSSEEENCGMVSQLVLNKHDLWLLLSLICR